MRDDSPPEFVKFRTPEAPVDVYDLALELVRLVHIVIEHSAARFHLKDKLDRATTAVSVLIARANADLSQRRWQAYRSVIATISDIGVLLDVIDKQQASSKQDELAAARSPRETIGDRAVATRRHRQWSGVMLRR